MKTCEETQKLLPWVVNGALTGEEARQTAAHLAICPSCREELAATLRLAGALREAFPQMERAPAHGWEDVQQRLPELPSARLDLGSFLVGLSMGLSLARNGRPRVESDLRVLGRRVRLFNTMKKGGD
jgi:anti-sigma factor RsiW